MIMVLNKYDVFIFDKLLYVHVCLQGRSQHVIFYNGHGVLVSPDGFHFSKQSLQSFCCLKNNQQVTDYLRHSLIVKKYNESMYSRESNIFVLLNLTFHTAYDSMS